MSEVRLIVRDAERDWSGMVHGSTADRAIAALAADPMLLSELEVAFGRFEKGAPGHNQLVNLRPGLCDEPYDAGIVIIDLVARLVVVNSSYSFPGPSGSVDYHNGECCTRISLPYHLAEDWQLTKDFMDWRAVADERRKNRRDQPQWDTRQILYGTPLLDFIAQEVLVAVNRSHEMAAPRTSEFSEIDGAHQAQSEAIAETLRRIHAEWLMTPRDDLGGRSPREAAFEQRDHVSRDLQDQEERWTLVDECPPGIGPSSDAFQRGGIGTHEIVIYYDLVRALLWSCWEQLAPMTAQGFGLSGDGSPGVREAIASEVFRLEIVREDWLDTPLPDHHGRTPRSIIDRERARLPEGMTGRDAMIDPDCPCCQMLADMPGPMFWHLDGSEMDDDFAFDIYHCTREEWEAERREWEEHSRRFEAEQMERERLGLTHFDRGGRAENSIWLSSCSIGDAVDVPIGLRLFGIGGRLAELIADLRRVGDDSDDSSRNQIMIDRLNRDFGNLRALFQSSEGPLADVLIQPVVDRFTESLSAVACNFPFLVEKCDSLTTKLTRLLEPRTSELDWDDGDSEVPF